MNFWLSQILYEEMVAEAWKWSPLETGGALVGYVADSGDIVVTALIHAGPRARRTRWSFRPDAGFQNREIARHYEGSGRLDGYLGDWHTHPGGSSRMSWRDRRTLQAIADYPHARIRNPVMVILHGADWKPAPWQFSRRTLLAHAPCTPLVPKVF
jgi:integrative and conjugative element protein (TIGR02256 family)